MTRRGGWAAIRSWAFYQFIMQQRGVGSFDLSKLDKVEEMHEAREAPFQEALAALPLTYSAPQDLAFARRFGTKALWFAGLGYNTGVYNNNREKVVLHTSGSPNHTGDICVNPPPRSLRYWPFTAAVYHLGSFVPGMNQGLYDRLRVLQDNEQELIEYVCCILLSIFFSIVAPL
jgi:hypothetical protein